MKLAVFCLLLVACHAFPAEVEKDNKAVESKNVKNVAPTSSMDGEKTNKNEKRAPVVQTVVPGELKYGNKIEYSPAAYSPQIYQSAHEIQQVKYVSPDPKSPYYEPPQPAPKPQYLFYTPQSSAASHVPAMSYPAQAQLILMLAVPHPSGRYMMLYPAQNLLMPLFYGSGITHQASASSVPVPGYQSAPSAVPSPYQPAPGAYQASYSGPALAQHAGFVAQHQLAYSPYRTEKYSPSKQQ